MAERRKEAQPLELHHHVSHSALSFSRSMTTSALEDNSLRVTVAGRAVVWTLVTGDAELRLGSKPSERVPLRQVLWVEAHEGAVNVKFLRSERGSLKLANVGTIACEEDRAHVERWAGAVMDAAYHGKLGFDMAGRELTCAGLPRRRRLRVLINPASGKVGMTPVSAVPPLNHTQGQGPAMFRDIVQPILGAALCEFDVTRTDSQSSLTGMDLTRMQKRATVDTPERLLASFRSTRLTRSPASPVTGFYTKSSMASRITRSQHGRSASRWRPFRPAPATRRVSTSLGSKCGIAHFGRGND
jgi:hypothetical protein